VFIGTEFGQAGRVAHVGRTASRPQLLLPAGRQPVALLPEYAESLGANEVKLLGTARDNLLNAAQNPRLRDAINNLYRPGAKLGSGSSMEPYASKGRI